MSGGPRFYDSGSFIKPVFSSISTATAGGAGDNTAVTGAAVDRVSFGSSAVAVAYRGVLAAAATLSLTVDRQTSEDGTTWSASTTLYPKAVVAAGAGGGSTETGVLKVLDSYEAKPRYVRYVVTPDLSAGATDTASIAVTVVLGGPHSDVIVPIP